MVKYERSVADTDRTKCLRCGGEMLYVGREHLQKGKAGVLLGSWDNILSGALDVEIYVCKKCRKIEMYAAEGAEEAEEDGGIAQIPCPYCGKLHDLDDAVCPKCGRRLQELDPLDEFKRYYK